MKFHPLSAFDTNQTRRARQNAFDALTCRESGVVIDGDDYMYSRNVRGNALEKGMIVVTKWGDNYDVMRVLGVSDQSQKYGSGGVVFDNVRDAMRASNVKSLRALESHDDENEYGFASYLWVETLLPHTPDASGDDVRGPWGYLFKGRWTFGSDNVSFRLLERAHIVKAQMFVNECKRERERAEKHFQYTRGMLDDARERHARSQQHLDDVNVALRDACALLRNARKDDAK